MRRYFYFFYFLRTHLFKIEHTQKQTLSRKDLVLAPWQPPKTAQWGNVAVWNLKSLPKIALALLVISNLKIICISGPRDYRLMAS
jgi:hypothetical protein